MNLYSKQIIKRFHLPYCSKTKETLKSLLKGSNFIETFITGNCFRNKQTKNTSKECILNLALPQPLGKSLLLVLLLHHLNFLFYFCASVVAKSDFILESDFIAF